MPLMVRDICSIMEKFAPEILSESFDNVGLMVGNLEANVSSILVALDCTLEVIEEAKEKNCNFILTHHPLLFHKPSSITSETLLGKKIIKLIDQCEDMRKLELILYFVNKLKRLKCWGLSK